MPRYPDLHYLINTKNISELTNALDLAQKEFRKRRILDVGHMSDRDLGIFIKLAIERLQDFESSDG